MKQFRKMNKLSKELAAIELNKWLESRGVDPEDFHEIDEDTGKDYMRERVEKAFQSGRLSMDPKTFELKYKLRNNLESESGEFNLSEITIKHRYRQKDLDNHLKGVKIKDSPSREKAYLAAITGIDLATLGLLYDQDYNILQAIYVLFLR